MLLLNNPEKLKLLEREIFDTFLSKSTAANFANTQDLPYLNAVINESMRIEPIITVGKDIIVIRDSC
jgi:cytochrome P450